jgi:diguanylate cyclase (GGDEF)-like protein/PAS domain S-box-containing protein
MEQTGNHRFNRKFMQAVTVLGALALLFSIYLWPMARLGVPFFLLALLCVQTSSRYSVQIPRGRGRIRVTDAFVFLSMLLFGGDAAVLFAALAGLCLSLRSGKSALQYLFNTSLTIVSAFTVVWAVRLVYGPLTSLGQPDYSIAFFEAVGLAILVQAVFNSAVIMVGGAYKIQQALWRTASTVFFWNFVAYAFAVVACHIVAILVGAMGFNAFMAVTAIAALCHAAFRIYLMNMEDRHPQEERVGAKVGKDDSERFRSAFDHAAIGMAIVSSEGRWLQVNRSLCSLLGYSARDLMATDFLTITHPDDLGTALSSIKELLKGKIPSHQMEKRYIHKQGHEVWVLWNVSLARDAYTGAAHLIFQIQDITDRKRAEERLLHDAFHDALTGLPNRALFMDHLGLAIARSKRNSDQKFAVLYLDLDRFKIINDSLGHMIGDQLLVGIARRLELCLRPGDTIARLGGDEFTVLIEDITDDSDTIYVAERIQSELTVPFTLNGREVFTTVSIGIAPGSSNYERAEDILRDADTAMYRAKTMGKARHEIFDKAMHARAMNLLQLETDLRRAIEREEFFVQYQPIVSLETSHLRGFEALVRWRHPTRGLISPIDFIPVAEETGLIIQIGEWVLRESCRQMQQWQTLFPSDPPMFISVNLSGKQFTQPDLINEVAHILDETGLNPRNLKLEITESVVMENIETATEMLKQLRALGVKLSIDDFGTGYSSLSYLHRFPIDTLKIDRSFVTQMSDNNENMEIVRTVVMLAQNLGMDVVAEGVETTEQLSLLQRLGCEFGQGYFFSKPVDATSAEKIIAETYSTPQAPSTSNNTSRKVVLVA